MKIDKAQLEADGWGILYPASPEGIIATKDGIGLKANGEEMPMPAQQPGDNDGSRAQSKADAAAPVPGSKAAENAAATAQADSEPAAGGKRVRRGSKKSSSEISEDASTDIPAPSETPVQDAD